MAWKINIRKNCCDKGIKISLEKNRKGFFRGLIYGLIPHCFCILFIIFSALGATIGTVFFRKLLLIPYLFPFLICLSLIFATLSAVIYLRKNNELSSRGIKRKWKYLSILYGTTIFINLLFFYVIFPTVSNIDFSRANNNFNTENSSLSLLVLEVDIPCSGHAPLIIDELKKVNGIREIKFRLPNLFDVYYNSQTINSDEILNQDIFNSFKAIIRK